MGSRDPRIDTYIAEAADFAKPVLAHLRALVHQACPDVEETIKWRMPFFVHHGMLCHMAAFKAHCSFHIPHGEGLSVGRKAPDAEGMGQFGRITGLGDLPGDADLIGFVQEAALRNANTPKTKGKAPKAVTGATTKASPVVTVPEDLVQGLQANPAAAAVFEAFTAAQRRAYIEWLDEAKQDATRKKRLQTTLEWLAEGKTRNWKYEKKAAT